MNRIVKRYLRQVEKHLCCPNSLRKEFLLQLKDDLLLYCEDKADVNYTQLVEHFGQPKEIAETFFSEMDARIVSRFAYTRLQFGYIAIAIVFVVAISVIGFRLFDYFEIRRLALDTRIVESITHKDGSNCTTFWVRTIENSSKETYWEYHTCENVWLQIPKPKEATGSETPAVEIYTNSDGIVTHWKYDSKNNLWKVVSKEE